MLIMLTLLLPLVALLTAGFILIFFDVCLTYIIIAHVRPNLLPVRLKQQPLASLLITSSEAPADDLALDNIDNTVTTPADNGQHLEQASPATETTAIKTALIDNVNHEIRTPLAGIMATAQILHDEVGADHQELTEMLVENGKRMNNAISNVIELVAFKENEYQIDKVPFHINEEINALLALYKKQAQLKGITLDLAPINKELTLITDPQLLRKVLNHLINNAIKFTDAGSVKLSVKKDKSWLHVEIKDTGVGISKAFLPDIYKPFMQGSQGLTRTYNGQGLGLALTKRMIDLAGGKISIDSSSGRGSTFTVSYPDTEEL